MDWSHEELTRWIGRDAVDADGDKIGELTDIYIDDATGDPEWLAVTTGLFGRNISFVPLRGATEDGDKVKVAHAKSVVKDGPNVEADGELNEEEERRLYRHFGLSYETMVADEADITLVDMQDSGSASVSSEIRPDVARRRLRRSDADSVDFIDLDDEESRGRDHIESEKKHS